MLPAPAEGIKSVRLNRSFPCPLKQTAPRTESVWDVMEYETGEPLSDEEIAQLVIAPEQWKFAEMGDEPC